MSPIPSTPPRPDAPQLTDEEIQESDRHSPFTTISTQLITLLISFLSNVPLVTHSVDIFTALFLIVSMALVSTASSEQRKSPGPQPPPRFESSRLHDLIHHTLRGVRHRVDSFMPRSGMDVPVVFSIGCCTRHSTPATKLIPIWFISFHFLSLVNPFVPMSAMFDSVGMCFVTNFSSMDCCNHSHFTSMWRHFLAPSRCAMPRLATETQIA